MSVLMKVLLSDISDDDQISCVCFTDSKFIAHSCEFSLGSETNWEAAIWYDICEEGS